MAQSIARKLNLSHRNIHIEPSPSLNQPHYRSNDIELAETCANSALTEDAMQEVTTNHPSTTEVEEPLCSLSTRRLQFSSIQYGKSNWRTIFNLLLSVYSTVLSGVWLVVAIARPRYGQFISPTGILPSTATTLCAIFAKSIEISSVAVFVVSLGQLLTRRSLSARGISLADITMRYWIIQPSLIFTRAGDVRHAGTNALGIFTILTALSVLFFTSASDALVSPNLKSGKWERTILKGGLQTFYGDAIYASTLCRTPLGSEMDPEGQPVICPLLGFTDFALHDFDSFMNTWYETTSLGGGFPLEIASRPQPTSSTLDKLAVKGSWVNQESSNVAAKFEELSRIVNNVTLSMPHSVVYFAAQDAAKNLPQPTDGSGFGEYTVRASVLSPTANCLCANVLSSELAPLVYVEWPNARISGESSSLFDDDGAPHQKLPPEDWVKEAIPFPGKMYLNSTTVDDIFEWGEKYENMPPVFPSWPEEYSSVLNYGDRNASDIYILIKAPVAITVNYTLCKIHVALSSSCPTVYENFNTGGHLTTTCEDEKISQFDPPTRSDPPNGSNTLLGGDMRGILMEWALSLSLRNGALNDTITVPIVPRSLSQLVIGEPASGKPTLDSTLPSLAEAISTLLGSVLIKASINSSFNNPSWDFTRDPEPSPHFETFHANFTSRQYVSGPTLGWQKAFYLVFFSIFAANVICLVYLLSNKGLVVDFSDPHTSFAAAINSPQNKMFTEKCDDGPQGKQLGVAWNLKQDEGNGYYFEASGEGGKRN